KKGRLVGLGRRTRSVPPSSAPPPFVDPEVFTAQLKDKNDRNEPSEISDEHFLGISRRNIPRDSFLGIFRGLRYSKIPDESSEEHFVGTSEDWTIGKSIEISRGSSPTVYSDDLSDELVVLGVSSEFISSEFRRKFPRDFRGKMNFRGVISEDLFHRDQLRMPWRKRRLSLVVEPPVLRCYG
uniref:Uncharacterized protein n=1 Tax=Brassica oleracea var. oleracea TaxID=109376 RepID=A0A0D3BEU0_BRAOL